jgi:hypothetical protein
MAAKKKKVQDQNSILTIKPMLIAVCGGCEWYFESDNRSDSLKALNEHLSCEHHSDEDAYTDSRIFVADKQVQLGLEDRKELTIGRV